MESKKPSKQRKALYSADFSRLKREMHAHLSKALREKYNRRSFGVIKGDTVKVMAGDSKGKEGKIDRVALKERKIYIEGVSVQKVNGTSSKLGVYPSKVMITALELKDKRRKDKLSPKESSEGAKQ